MASTHYFAIVFTTCDSPIQPVYIDRKLDGFIVSLKVGVGPYVHEMHIKGPDGSTSNGVS